VHAAFDLDNLVECVAEGLGIRLRMPDARIRVKAKSETDAAKWMASLLPFVNPTNATLLSTASFDDVGEQHVGGAHVGEEHVGDKTAASGWPVGVDTGSGADEEADFKGYITDLVAVAAGSLNPL
jgi:hypothetical protein